MFIGHLGAGLVLKKFDPRLNLGLLFAAVLLPDLVLWLFVLIGLEHLVIPANFDKLRYVYYIFPYSHSLAAVLLWSLCAYAFGRYRSTGKRAHRAGIVLAVGVFSHFVLDAIVHPPQIPLWGEMSPMIGLGLWNAMAVALLVELLLLVVGLFTYYRSTRAERFAGKYGILILFFFLTPAAFLGQIYGPKPETATQIAVSSFLTLIIVIFLAWRIDRKRSEKTEKGIVEA